MNITENVIKAREGNTEAISALYNEYKNRVYFLCLRFMDNEKDAGIVLQYTFFQAFHRLAVLRNPENFGMWLFIIAANRCRVLLREKNPELFKQPDVSSRQLSRKKFTNTYATDVLPEAAADADARAAVLQITDRLPLIYRMPVILYYYCRMNFAQAAKIMESDENHIRLYLSQAEASIKKETGALAEDIEKLRDFSIDMIGTVLDTAAAGITIPADLSENIIATSATLAASSAGYPYFDGKEKSEIKFSPPDSVPDAATGQKENGEQESADSIKYESARRIALRNLITVGVVLALAASIIIGSIIVIKKAEDSIAMSSGVVTEETDAPGDSTDDPIKETTGPDVTEPPVTEPPVTEPPVTEPPVTEPPVTEPPVTEPPVTEPPVTEKPADNDPEIRFETIVNGNEITISKYTGTAKEVDIPANIGGKPVTQIAPFAFQYNKTLVSVKIPSSVKKIGGSAFRGCTSLSTVAFAQGLASIDDYAFLECTALSSFKIPSSVTHIGVSAFGSTAWIASQKTSFLTGGDGVLIKYFGPDAEVSVPEGIKSLANAFYYKYSVTKIVLPSSVTAIGTYAFCNCPNLKSITIPDSVTSILKDAIYECKSLSEIKVKAGSYAETWCKDNGFGDKIVNY